MQDLFNDPPDFDFNKASLFNTPLGKFTLQHDMDFLLKKIDETTPAFHYTRSVHHALVNIHQSFSNLELTFKLIEFARPNIKSFKMTKVERGEYLQYHFENYYFRLPKLKDQALQLINMVYRLGLPQSLVSEARPQNAL